MSVGSGGWYVRGRGRVLGPFNWSQLESMRDRGQLTQLHEVSQDRRSWMKAADVPGLFTPVVVAPSQPAATGNVEWAAYPVADEAGASPVAPTAGAGAASWFIGRGDTHQGPLSIADLQRMIENGELGPSSLVWTNGMANWVPASQVPELRFATSAGTGAGANSGAVPALSGQSYQRSGSRQPGPGTALALRHRQSFGHHLRRCLAEPDHSIERDAHRQGHGGRGPHPGYRRISAARAGLPGADPRRGPEIAMGGLSSAEQLGGAHSKSSPEEPRTSPS